MPIAYMEASLEGTASVSTYAVLYDTTGTDVSAIVGTIIVCNTAATPATYRIAVTDTDGTPTSSDWRFYDCAISPNDTIPLVIGLSLQNGKYLQISSSATTLTFAAEIAEMTP